MLLVQPAPFENGRIGLENSLWFTEPVALTSIAAEVPEDHKVKIFNLRLKKADELPKTVESPKPSSLLQGRGLPIPLFDISVVRYPNHTTGK